LNLGGYFDQLLAFFRHAETQGFIRAAHREMLLVESDVEGLLARFRDYEAPRVGKWMPER
jgi:predicted Rossmann-fold nucleotide-binding protein